MKHVFIVNKLAGKGDKVKTLMKQIKELYRNQDYQIALVDDQYAASEVLIKYSSKEELIIYACGGDGTLHEVVNAMMHYHLNQAKLIVIPIGTGNDFAKSLNCSKEDLMNLNNYRYFEEQVIDLLKVDDDIYGINTVSAGLDVTIAQNVYKFKKLPFKDSTFPYYLSLINSMMNKITTKLKLKIDNRDVDYNDYTFVVASNGVYYGGGYLPNPQATFDDGIMDICLIKKVSRCKIAFLQKKYKKGTHVEYTKLVEQHRCKKMTIVADEPLALNIDGEVKIFNNPEITLVNQAIKIIVPKLNQ